MPVNLVLPLSLVLGLISWILLFRWYVHPWTSRFSTKQILEPILLLHTFRYIGLMFLVPGVTSEPLDMRFAGYAAFGDLAAAFLAMLALYAVRTNRSASLPIVVIFNTWGLADLLNAVVRGLIYTQDGHLGATYWIPAVIVPLLVVSHFYVFYLITFPVLDRTDTESA